jgi:hypothetical protein
MSQAIQSTPETQQRDSNVQTVPCPHCGKATDSLKHYRPVVLVFLVFAGFWKLVPHISCPRCMRLTLAKFALINLPTANVFWPLALIPNGMLFLTSFVKGHSKVVRQHLGMS